MSDAEADNLYDSDQQTKRPRRKASAIAKEDTSSRRVTRRKVVDYAAFLGDDEDYENLLEEKSDEGSRKRPRSTRSSRESASNGREKLDRSAKRAVPASMQGIDLGDTESEREDNEDAQDAEVEQESDSDASHNEEEEDEQESDDDTISEEDMQPSRRGKQRMAKSKAKAKSKYLEESDEDSEFEEPKKRKKTTPRKHTSRKYSTKDQKAVNLIPGDEEHVEYRIQVILTHQAKLPAEWKEICKDMNTEEVTLGSVWRDDDAPALPEDTPVEKYLVKWRGLSYMHVSWETEDDLIEQVGPTAKASLKGYRTRVANDEDLFFEELRDNEYFPPSYLEVERVVDIDEADDSDTDTLSDSPEHTPHLRDNCRLALKWAGLPYLETTFESVEDLKARNIEFMDAYEAFQAREREPSRQWRKQIDRSLELEEAADDEKEVPFINGNFLRGYQWEGVRWMVYNWTQNRNSILADEMGLGKTIQASAFLEILSSKKDLRGPFLIIVPLSTMTNWYRELQTWSNLDVVQYHGSSDDREVVREYEFKYVTGQHSGTKLHVLLSTPEVCLTKDATFISRIKWEVLIFDEAHRLKNFDSKLARNLRTSFHYRNCILLTGTPLQNNTEELWALLNFVDPAEFPDLAEFLEEFGELGSVDKLDALQQKLKPYFLRRLKEDVEKKIPGREEIIVEVELTAVQKQYYRAIYEKNVAFLSRGLKASDAPQMLNLAMELRKCCNHPFLLRGAENELQKYFASEGKSEVDCLIDTSGKLVLLDKLLPKLKAEGRKVLLFSQFRIMLDILEDYMITRDYSYERVDGEITGPRRQFAIDRFSSPDDNLFVMLLSTRAGGVGINLTAADVVVLYDSDWNPQNDLQAMARCHRIGQTNTVNVYRLVTAKSYEMQMFKDASLKLGLDQAVLHSMRENWLQRKDGNTESAPIASRKEVENLLKYGAYDIFREAKDGKAEEESKKFADESIDTILARATRITRGGENTESTSSIANSMFSHASFVPSTEAQVDMNDPSFWSKVVGLPMQEKQEEISKVRKCRAAVKSYAGEVSDGDESISEHEQQKAEVGSQAYSDHQSSSDDDESDDGYAIEEGQSTAAPKPARPKASIPKESPKVNSDAAMLLAQLIANPTLAPTQTLEGWTELFMQYPQLAQRRLVQPPATLLNAPQPAQLPARIPAMVQPPPPPHPPAAVQAQPSAKLSLLAALPPPPARSVQTVWTEGMRDQLFKEMLGQGPFKYADISAALKFPIPESELQLGCYWIIIRLIFSGSTFPQTVAGTNAAKELFGSNHQSSVMQLEPVKLINLMKEFLVCRVACYIYFGLGQAEGEKTTLNEREAALFNRVRVQRFGSLQPFIFGNSFLDTGVDVETCGVISSQLAHMDLPSTFTDVNFVVKMQKKVRQSLQILQDMLLVQLVVNHCPLSVVKQQIEVFSWRERPRPWWTDTDDLCLLQGIDFHGLPENQQRAQKLLRDKRLPWTHFKFPENTQLTRQELSRRLRLLQTALFADDRLSKLGASPTSLEYKVWRALICFGRPHSSHSRCPEIYRQSVSYALTWSRFAEHVGVSDEPQLHHIVKELLREMDQGTGGQSSVLPMDVAVLRLAKPTLLDMEKLRLLLIVLDWNDLQWWCGETSSYPVNMLPAWWSPRHDRRLLWAVVKYGWYNWGEMLSQQVKPFTNPLPEAADIPVLPGIPLENTAFTHKFIEFRCRELASKIDARLNHVTVFSGAVAIQRDDKNRFVSFIFTAPRFPFGAEDHSDHELTTPLSRPKRSSLPSTDSQIGPSPIASLTVREHLLRQSVENASEHKSDEVPMSI